MLLSTERVTLCGRANDRFLRWFIRVHLAKCTLASGHTPFIWFLVHAQTQSAGYIYPRRRYNGGVAQFNFHAPCGGKALVLYLSPIMQLFSSRKNSFPWWAGGGVREKRLTKKHISDPYYTRLSCITLNLASSWAHAKLIVSTHFSQTTISFSCSDAL